MAAIDNVFSFYVENNTEGRTERNLRKSQVTVERLGIIFKLAHQTIFLTEDFGSSEFPTADGLFPCLENSHLGASFKVEGEPLSLTPTPQQTAQQVVNGAVSSTNTIMSTPLSIGAFRRSAASNLPHSTPLSSGSPSSSSRKRRQEMHSLKVVYADVENPDSRHRKIGSPRRTTFINIDETSANVSTINEMVNEAFGFSDLVIVMASCMPYEESEGTRGLTFWKVNSRKVFAVNKIHLLCDDETQVRQNSGTNERNNEMMAILLEVKEELDNSKIVMAEMKNKLDNSLIVTAESSLPMIRGITEVRLGESVNSVFKCVICLSLATSPVMISTCCKQILGCRVCVDRWYEDNSSCPHCRDDIGRTPLNLQCFDVLLASCHQIFDV